MRKNNRKGKSEGLLILGTVLLIAGAILIGKSDNKESLVSIHRQCPTCACTEK